jgi:hypothetical protein
MLGNNAPLGHAVTLTTAAAPPSETSTEYYIRQLDALDRKLSSAASGDDEPLGEPGKPN